MIRKDTFILLIAVLILPVIVIAGCSSKRSENNKKAATVTLNKPVIGNETSLLLQDLEQNGDYVNSKGFPSLIKASIVEESLGKNTLIIDLRSPGLYRAGHIIGAVNKKFQDLPDYFESGIRPFEYDKIILVSEDGQISSYAASLLRLMNYGNVYSMRWGMSAWNKKYAVNGWLKGISGKYENNLEMKENEKPSPGAMPELKTGKKTGEEIAEARFRELFAEGTSNVLISADEVFSDPSGYYIINYERKDRYDDGHIPGAVRYKPAATLGFPEEMATIPPDRTVVVYCSTGHNSGFATAYLRLLGYDAKTLKYGNNGFMHDKMVQQKSTLSWLPFSNQEINDFPDGK